MKYTATNMNSLSKSESARIKRLAGTYNMVANLFWTVLLLAPLSVFCYQHISRRLLYIFAAISVASIFLPNSFFDKIQPGKTTGFYKKLGIGFFNRFIQNGVIVNRLLRKKYPHYKLVSKHSNAVKKLYNQTYMFEKFHFMMLLFFLLTTAYALFENYLLWALVMLLTNIVYNVYPNLLQQYIRLRLRSSSSRSAT